MPSSYSANFSICIIRRKLLTERSLRLRSARRVIRAESADACRLPGPYLAYTSPKTGFSDIVDAFRSSLRRYMICPKITGHLY